MMNNEIIRMAKEDCCKYLMESGEYIMRDEKSNPIFFQGLDIAQKPLLDEIGRLQSALDVADKFKKDIEEGNLDLLQKIKK